MAGAIALVLSASLSGPAFAQVDLHQSTVVATLRHKTLPVDGRFRKFDAQVTFDPAKPANGSARVSVEMDSYELGDADVDRQVRGEDWFDAADYPRASFVSSSIVPAGDGKYSVTGRLTVRGKTRDVIVPVSVSDEGATRIFEGSLPVSRRRFGIGQGEWVATNVVADEVVIKFRLVVAK
ncbi:MAG: YceI family protein [Pararobbsia sp.]